MKFDRTYPSVSILSESKEQIGFEFNENSSVAITFPFESSWLTSYSPKNNLVSMPSSPNSLFCDFQNKLQAKISAFWNQTCLRSRVIVEFHSPFTKSIHRSPAQVRVKFKLQLLGGTVELWLFDLNWCGVKRPCTIICNAIWIHSGIKEMFRYWFIFPWFLLSWFSKFLLVSQSESWID